MSAHDKEAAERERFEETFARPLGLDLTKVSGADYITYSDCNTDYAWLAWIRRAALSSPAEAGGKEIIAAPPESYSDEDRAFHEFWYSHMKDELMTGPVRDVSYGSARYIWDAARAIEAKLTDR